MELHTLLNELTGKLNRAETTGVAKVFGFSVEHDEPGDYDGSRDGFMVFVKKALPGTRGMDQFVRVDFCDDSYSDGYISNARSVRPVLKTVTVYE